MKVIHDASIVLVCTDCTNTRILYHGIKESIPVSHIITELPVSRKTLIRRRIKRLGFWTTFGQLVFQVFCIPILRKLSKKRITQFITENGLYTGPMPEEKMIRLQTVNGDAFVKAIGEINPSLIIVNGTRIISQATLDQIKCPAINVHVGITPLYRGVHGAYWALANNDREHCGVTIHVVDKGIDTGNILAQGIIDPTKEDNFTTYPYLQFDKAISLLKKVVPAIIGTDQYSFQAVPAGKSRLWYHPTIWQYLYNRVKGVK